MFSFVLLKKLLNQFDCFLNQDEYCYNKSPINNQKRLWFISEVIASQCHYKSLLQLGDY